jgi:RNase P/RNase MRP subunit p30
MFDSCILFNLNEDFKKKLGLVIGQAVINDKLNFNSNELVFFSPKSEDDLKKAVEMTLPYGIINSELIHYKDSLHFIRSGIDDTIAKEMAKKKIAIVFNLNLIISNDSIKRSLIIRRMKENMKKAVKFDIPVLFASLAKNEYDLFNGEQIKSWAQELGIDNYTRVKNSFNKIFQKKSIK